MKGGKGSKMIFTALRLIWFGLVGLPEVACCSPVVVVVGRRWIGSEHSLE